MTDNININPAYVTWICYDCAKMYCVNTESRVCTWHTGICDICNMLRGVTEPRDFGGFKKVEKP